MKELTLVEEALIKQYEHEIAKLEAKKQDCEQMIGKYTGELVKTCDEIIRKHKQINRFLS